MTDTTTTTFADVHANAYLPAGVYTYIDTNAPAGTFVAATKLAGNRTPVSFLLRGELGSPEAVILGRIEWHQGKMTTAYKGNSLQGGEKLPEDCYNAHLAFEEMAR